MANLIETATEAGSFKTLVTAVERAGLVDILKGEGPYTVLAPTDDAFDQLPQRTLDSLLQDSHKLKQVLLYHVISGDVRSDDLAQIDEAPTMEGSVVAVEQTDGVRVNEAKILQTDILADNGVIHAIDAVLMPSILV
ncbi:MAG: fasciclin domain-containing protein [Leptolyngbyaceae cyanobacterium SL_5_9]|nr:fasciclin domain-containing protein [Leptolyngbyaceae cyanobacterium SL_5_9]NJO76974.1 fasciclin domain-containing protein [Leptolyngbyaceae cyanobacterium RM1_406_9]